MEKYLIIKSRSKKYIMSIDYMNNYRQWLKQFFALHLMSGTINEILPIMTDEAKIALFGKIIDKVDYPEGYKFGNMTLEETLA